MLQSMNSFAYSNQSLHVDNLPINTITDEIGTPVYIYSASNITRNYEAFANEFRDINHVVCYALKANSNLAIIRLLANLGSGFDAVSGGEIAKVLASGVDGNQIVFSGVGKSPDEMRFALEANIKQFNVESEPELFALNEIAGSLNKTAQVALRVNPDVDAKTHRKISTGQAENKFGIPINRIPYVFEQTKHLKSLNLRGIDIHIGSQIMSIEPYDLAFTKISDLVVQLRANGHTIDRIDLGGGLGVAYDPKSDSPITSKQYASLVKNKILHLDCEIEFEPGRIIIADGGILVTSILYVKTGLKRQFLVVDAAMNDLLRPAMYDAYHEIIPIEKPEASKLHYHYDVVGPVCETSDTFAEQRLLPEVKAGDNLAILSAGAYCSSMSSEYNCRPLVPEVLANQSNWSVIRPRQEIKSQIEREFIPEWL